MHLKEILKKKVPDRVGNIRIGDTVRTGPSHLSAHFTKISVDLFGHCVMQYKDGSKTTLNPDHIIYRGLKTWEIYNLMDQI